MARAQLSGALRKRASTVLRRPGFWNVQESIQIRRRLRSGDGTRYGQSALAKPPSGTSSALRSPPTMAPTLRVDAGRTKFTKYFAATTLPS